VEGACRVATTEEATPRLASGLHVRARGSAVFYISLATSDAEPIATAACPAVVKATLTAIEADSTRVRGPAVALDSAAPAEEENTEKQCRPHARISALQRESLGRTLDLGSGLPP
jgi:hypothetical protein